MRFRFSALSFPGAAFLALAASALVASAPVAGAEAPDAIAAEVNGSKIYRSEVERYYQSLSARYKSTPLDQLYGDLLDSLVTRKAVAQAAGRAGTPRHPKFIKQLAFVREQVLVQVYLDQAAEAAVTVEQLRDAYDDMVADLAEVEEVRASHILLKSRAEAEKLVAEIKKGADFGDMARQHSTGPSGPQGGDLGYFAYDQMVPDFSAAAFALQPGEVGAEPVETQFGWHIIKVEDRRPVTPPKFEAVVAELRRQEVSLIRLDVEKELREKAAVTLFGRDGKPRP